MCVVVTAPAAAAVVVVSATILVAISSLINQYYSRLPQTTQHADMSGVQSVHFVVVSDEQYLVVRTRDCQ